MLLLELIDLGTILFLYSISHVLELLTAHLDNLVKKIGDGPLRGLKIVLVTLSEELSSNVTKRVLFISISLNLKDVVVMLIKSALPLWVECNTLISFGALLWAEIILLRKIYYEDYSNISRKSQVVYALAFSCQFFGYRLTSIQDIFSLHSSILIIISVLSTVIFLSISKKSAEQFVCIRHDSYSTTKLSFLIFVMVVVAQIVSDTNPYTLIHNYGIFIETIAIVPQLHLMDSARYVDRGVHNHVYYMTIYKMFRILNELMINRRMSVLLIGVFQLLGYMTFFEDEIKSRDN